MSRKRWKLIPEQNKPVFALFPALLEGSKSVQESIWFSERMGGGCNSGRPEPQTPLVKLGGQLSYAEVFSFRMTVFAPVHDRREVCRQTAENEKSGGRSFRNGLRLCYFQSLNKSSRARSRAVFMLFCMKERISASSTDFFFFFFRLSRALISASPRL